MGREYFGIDFGTSTTIAAWINARGEPDVCKISGRDYVDSVISFDEDGEPHVGDINEAWPEVYREFKLDIGRSGSLGGLSDGWPTSRTPLNLTTLLMQYVKGSLDRQSVEKAKNPPVVVTVPAGWSPNQRRDTQLAVMAADFGDVMLIDEPSSAILHYATVQQKLASGELALVFDFGGGTLDTCVVEYCPKAKVPIQVLGAECVELGGRHMDDLIASYLMGLFEHNHKTTLDPEDSIEGRVQREILRQLSRAAKERLSGACELKGDGARHLVNRMNFVDDKGLYEWVDYGTLRGIIKPVLDRIVEPVSAVLKRVNLDKRRLSQAILVGGSSLIPDVRVRLQDYLEVPCVIAKDPMTAVAKGAALYHREIMKSLPGIRPVNKIADDGYGVVISRDGRRENDLFVKQSQELPVQVWKEYATVEEGAQIRLECVRGTSSDIRDCETLGVKVITLERPVPAGTEVDIEIVVDENCTIHLYPFIRIRGKLVACSGFVVEGAQISQDEIRKQVQRVKQMRRPVAHD